MTTPLSSQPPPSGKDEEINPAVQPQVKEQYGFTLQDQPVIYSLVTGTLDSGDFRKNTQTYQKLRDDYTYSMRTNQTPSQVIDDSWEVPYGEILGNLPMRLQRLIQREMEKPFAERRPDVVAFDQFLKLVATGSALLEEAGVTPPPGSLQADKLSETITLTHTAYNGSISFAETLQRVVQEYLLETGHNNPHFDDLSAIGQEINQILRDLRSAGER
ncbi:MAG: hypothetical protein WD595_04410 [Waddliaceae bacterium]